MGTSKHLNYAQIHRFEAFHIICRGRHVENNYIHDLYITLLSMHAYSLCVGVVYGEVNRLEIYIQSAGT